MEYPVNALRESLKKSPVSGEVGVGGVTGYNNHHL